MMHRFGDENPPIAFAKIMACRMIGVIVSPHNIDTDGVFSDMINKIKLVRPIL
jgi:hypothetical protein